MSNKLKLPAKLLQEHDQRETEPDYFAVYVQRAAKARGSFLLNVLARGKADALRIARNHGHQLPRWSYAVHIGKEGYFAALRSAFRMN